SAWLAVMSGVSIADVDVSADQYLEGSPLDRNILTGLLAIGLIVVLGRRQKVAEILRANPLILLFFFYCGVSVLLSDYPDGAFKRWIRAIGDFMMVLIVLTDLNPSDAINRLLSRVGFLLLPLSILFIKYYPALGRTYDPGFGFWTPVYTGVTTNKNELGYICLIF